MILRNQTLLLATIVALLISVHAFAQAPEAAAPKTAPDAAPVESEVGDLPGLPVTQIPPAKTVNPQPIVGQEPQGADLPVDAPAPKAPTARQNQTQAKPVARPQAPARPQYEDWDHSTDWDDEDSPAVRSRFHDLMSSDEEDYSYRRSTRRLRPSNDWGHGDFESGVSFSSLAISALNKAHVRNDRLYALAARVNNPHQAKGFNCLIRRRSTSELQYKLALNLRSAPQAMAFCQNLR